MTLPVGFYVNRIIAHLYFKVYIAKRAKKKNRLTAIPLSVRDRIRTHDLLVRSQTLYPAELRAPGIGSSAFNVHGIQYHIQNKKSNIIFNGLIHKNIVK